ncbi:PAS domain-containing protein [Parasphingorhabdus sp.]|uniref:PAS domain-containing protein n=1 Tax=Parasphingorhabdus sp. TaxID=2709688 RepID=UPI003BB02BA4
MENLRNSGENMGLSAGSDADYIAYEDEDVTSEAPPAIGQDERRMHVRAYNFWAGLLGDRQFPSVEDLDPESDKDFGPNSVLLDFTNGVENPSIQFLGKSLRQECELDESITSIDQVPARSLLSRITDHYLQIIANQAPIGFEAEFVNQRGVTIMYRGILLPFSTDDDTIDFIYGVINWKEVAGDEFAKELEEQVAQAMRSAPAKTETGPIWADSPTSGPLELTAEDVIPAPDTIVGSDHIDLEDISDQPDEDACLADWLVAARSSADNAAHSEQRSRAALYKAIGQAYDFYLMTETYPQDYATLLEDSGLKAQERAPMTPIVKLVFGAHYDKTRLTEYAAALRFAKQAGIEKGAFADYLENYDGGLKAVVYAERDARNPKQKATDPVLQNEDVLERLRSAPGRELHDIDAGDAEFIVLVARQDEDGQLSIVGPVLGDQKLTEKALKQTSV